MSNIIPYNDMQQMAEVAANSKMFGFKNPQEALAIMLLCQAENMHPAVAMRDYHVIQGRPALKADAMLARFQAAGGSVTWNEYTDEQVTGVFMHPQGGTLELGWSLAQAKRIGIANKDNWSKYPRAMLRARTISEGIRAVFPGCVVGVYTPEEVQDFEPKTKHMGNVVHVESVSESEVLSPVQSLAYALMIPGAEEAYASYATMEEWLDAFNAMLEKIQKSAKLTEEGKEERIQSLEQCNATLLAKLTPVEVTV
jgi:hypothetical protein